MFVVRSKVDDVVPAYLGPGPGDNSSEIRAGETITIERLLVRESPNGRETIVLGRCGECEVHTPISLFYLFKSDWLWTIAHREGDPSEKTARQEAADALRPDQAEWCR
jgi:hypothetical protein